MALILSLISAHFFVGFVIAGDGPRNFSGTQVLKIFRDPNGATNRLIRERSLDVWGRNATHIDVLVPHKSLKPVKQYLRAERIPFSTMIPDVQRAIQQEQPPTSFAKAGGKRMNWDQYQRLDVIHSYLDSLARTYSSFVSVGEMGRSVENRPLKYIKISSGKRSAKAVFIDGGIHAREWVSPATVTYIIRELVENRKRLSKELQELDFYIIPVLNPDGYEYSHIKDRMWRKNRNQQNRCVGTDLNRNFGSHWAGLGTSGDPCSEIYRGKAAFSEPESRALQSFLTRIRSSLKAYLTFHSYGQFILIPYAYDNNKPAPGFAQMKQAGDAAARAIKQLSGETYTVGNTADTLEPGAGGSDDWAKEKLGVPYAYTIELRDEGGYGFILPAKFIKPTASEAFEIVKVISAGAAKA